MLEKPLELKSPPSPRARQSRGDRRSHWRKGILFFILLLIGVTMIFPFVWMLATSFKTIDPAVIAKEGASSSIFPSGGNLLLSLFPKIWHWENYVEIFRKVPFGLYFWNSLLVSSLVTVGQLVTSSLAAFAFSRMIFRGRDQIFFAYLGTLMVPASVTIIPTFILFSKIGLVDSLPALILPPLFGAYGTFMLRQFFMGIPAELEEAAVMDGCGSLRVFWHVILPLAKPALATLGVFTFIGNWQSLFGPLILIHSDENKTVPLGLLNFVDLNSADWPRLMAASLLSIIPMVVLFLAAQRFFVSGIRSGGVKG